MAKTIAEITKEYKECKIEELTNFIRQYEAEERTSIQKLILKAQKQLDSLNKEKERIKKMKHYENMYSDYQYICGIDEVGRGPLAGPVIACAVILPKDCDLLYLNDSKQLSEKKREELYEQIMQTAVAVGIGSSSHETIDEINILQATYQAMQKAVEKLAVTPDLLLNDAVTIPNLSMKQVPIVKGDAKSISIAAASIVAKVTRDRLMVEYDQVFPGYGFAANKGYGSSEHIKALKEQGPSPIHRQSFIKNFL